TTAQKRLSPTTAFSARTLCAIADAEISARAGRCTPSTCTRVFRARYDEGGRGHRRVRQGDMELVGTAPGGEFGGRAVQHHRRRATRRALHFDRLPGHRAGADAQGFHDRLFDGEARGESFGLAAGVALFALGEESIDDSWSAPENDLKSRHVDDVDADTDCGHYSTVTVLARFRGRSTLRPSPRATAEANICKETTPTIGVNIGSVCGTR